MFGNGVVLSYDGPRLCTSRASVESHQELKVHVRISQSTTYHHYQKVYTFSLAMTHHKVLRTRLFRRVSEFGVFILLSGERGWRLPRLGGLRSQPDNHSQWQ